jgi:hypothetical protein
LDLLRRSYPVPANNKVVLAAKLSANPVEGSSHLPGYIRFREIGGGFIAKRTLLRARTGTNWSFNGCHGIDLGNELAVPPILYRSGFFSGWTLAS